MSKWINKDLFGQFQEQKKQEKDAPAQGGMNRLDYIWPTPQKGTDTVPKVYEGRFLPDPKGNFYDKYYYHFFKMGEKWSFWLCPKTHNFDNWCPFCSVTSKLYMGTGADKKLAPNYKRKERYVGNFYIVDDPRDSERDDDNKMNKTIKLYEFPGKVEMKLKEEITDSRNGLSYSIFDPGEGGYNFILKVMSTKKDRSGNVWPDYSNSAFARRPSALGTNSEIEEIMAKTFDLKEYIKGLERTDDDIIKALKGEMLWDIVSDEWAREKGKLTSQTTTATVEEDDDIPEKEIYAQLEKKEEDKSFSESTGDRDEDLLAELENL